MNTRTAQSIGKALPSRGRAASSILLVFALAALIACLCAVAGQNQKAFAAQAGDLAAGSVELAAQDNDEPGIYVQGLWAGLDSWEYVRTENLPEDATFVSVKSSNTKVLKAKPQYEDIYNIRLYPLKTGKSTVTLKYKTGGKTKTLTATYTVRALPKPFKSIKVNGTSVKVTSAKYKKNRVGAYKLKGTKLKVNVEMAKGWTLSYMGFGSYTPGSDNDDYTSKAIESGKSYSFPKAKEGDIWIDVHNDKDQYFDFSINVSHCGPVTLPNPVAYAGYTTGASVRFNEDVSDIKLTKAVSSNTKILKVKRVGSKVPDIRLTGVKTGKATLTVTYKFGGKTYKDSGVVTVTKHPNPFKSVVVNGKSVKLSDNPFSCGYAKYKKATAKVKITPRSGWKIESMVYSNNKAGKEKKIKNGASFKTPKSTQTVVFVRMKNKKGAEFVYPVFFARV